MVGSEGGNFGFLGVLEPWKLTFPVVFFLSQNALTSYSLMCIEPNGCTLIIYSGTLYDRIVSTKGHNNEIHMLNNWILQGCHWAWALIHEKNSAIMSLKIVKNCEK